MSLETTYSPPLSAPCLAMRYQAQHGGPLTC